MATCGLPSIAEAGSGREASSDLILHLPTSISSSSRSPITPKLKVVTEMPEASYPSNLGVAMDGTMASGGETQVPLQKLCGQPQEQRADWFTMTFDDADALEVQKTTGASKEPPIDFKFDDPILQPAIPQGFADTKITTQFPIGDSPAVVQTAIPQCFADPTLANMGDDDAQSSITSPPPTHNYGSGSDSPELNFRIKQAESKLARAGLDELVAEQRRFANKRSRFSKGSSLRNPNRSSTSTNNVVHGDPNQIDLRQLGHPKVLKSFGSFTSDLTVSDPKALRSSGHQSELIHPVRSSKNPRDELTHDYATDESVLDPRTPLTLGKNEGQYFNKLPPHLGPTLVRSPMAKHTKMSTPHLCRPQVQGVLR